MIVLLTGANGFIGKNIRDRLLKRNIQVVTLSHNDSMETICEKIKYCDLVIHTAAVQRSNNLSEYMIGNVGFTTRILSAASKTNKKIPLIYTSSINVEQVDNHFTQSKLEAERLIIEYSHSLGIQSVIYRLNHVFGRYALPYYNNVVTTMLYCSSHNLQFEIHDPYKQIEITYIDDLLDDFENTINQIVEQKILLQTIVFPSHKYRVSLLELYNAIFSFQNIDSFSSTIDVEVIEKLYSVYKYYQGVFGL